MSRKTGSILSFFNRYMLLLVMLDAHNWNYGISRSSIYYRPDAVPLLNQQQ